VDDNNKIIIKRIARDEKTGSAEETVHVFRPSPASRWLAYLLLIPAFIIMAVLGIFFFTAFLALFVVAAAALGFRLWWLRRKMRQSAEASEGEYLVIEDAEIIEERAARADDVNATKKNDEQHPGDIKGPKEI
jgi:hypothetical protein